MPDRARGQRERRLRWLLGLLFVGLALPAALLIRQGFAQIELAEFRRQQLIAEDLVRGVDARLAAAIAVENARPATDFDYAVTTTGRDGNVVRLSPLSSLAAAGSFPGTIGYFQVDTSGQFSTPLLPTTDRDSVPDAERLSKTNVELELANVLEANRLVGGVGPAPGARQESQQREQAQSARTTANDSTSEPASEMRRVDNVRGQAAFDELVSVSESIAEAQAPAAESAESDGGRVAAPAFADVRISTFSGELEPLRFSQLETGHLVLFRNAWSDGERYVQGMLIDRDAFIDESIDPVFANAGLAPGTRVSIAAAENRIATISVAASRRVDDIDATALYATRLSPPLADIEFAFTAGALARGPGFNLLVWTSLALFGVLVGGFLAMYRFGVQQMRLARQQQNFVSAVSHELKTPLTSIRMYGEMLKSGWADEEKKQVYYDYIFDEGERLSRLIDNVLQLARLNRSGPALALEPVSVGELIDVLRSKLSTQVERAGFELEIAVDPALADATIAADIDALVQVFINLVDNAIKFSGDAASPKILISARTQDADRLVLAVRDFGPGIPPTAMKRLFELFYRPDNELTRTTTGTGIGLALVRQLVTAMSGRVDVKNQEPGAEFRLSFPLEIKKGSKPFFRQ